MPAELQHRADRSPEEALARLYRIKESVEDGHATLADFDSELATIAWGLIRYHVPYGREMVGLILELTGRPELGEALDAVQQ
jgi:hypothetical protein